MKSQFFKTFGLEFPVEVPETVDEFDKLAGRSGAALDEAIMGVIYRGHLNRIRPAFLKLVEDESGVPREVIGSDEKGKDLLEKDANYFNRVTKGSGVAPSTFLPQLLEAAKQVGPLDPGAARSTGPTKEYIEAANGIIAGIKSGTVSKRTGEVVTAEAVISRLLSANPALQDIPLDSNGLPDVDSLAVAIRVDRERVIAEANASLF
jgi:hypothetical protein